MVGLIDYVVREVNPLRDFERTGYFKPDSEDLLQNSYVIVNGVLKGMVRGGLFGAGIGSLVCLVSGESNKEFVILTTALGAKIDYLQHLFRGALYPLLKNTVYGLKSIRNISKSS